jgi:hypothetical protein
MSIVSITTSVQPALFEVASVQPASERVDQPSILKATSLVEMKPSMERPPFAEPPPLVELATYTLSSAEPAPPAEMTSSVERIPSVVRVSFADRWSLTIAAPDRCHSGGRTPNQPDPPAMRP